MINVNLTYSQLGEEIYVHLAHMINTEKSMEIADTVMKSLKIAISAQLMGLICKTSGFVIHVLETLSQLEIHNKTFSNAHVTLFSTSRLMTRMIQLI